MALTVLHMMRPHKVLGSRKTRVGRVFDGGYVMLDDFDGITAAYSLGINDDVSWDLDMAGRGIPIYQYDHTIEALPGNHPLFHWEKTCISGKVDESRSEATIEHLVAKNGHENETDMLLKCDIEGSEWLALTVTPNAVLRQFRQIVLELHSMSFLSTMEHANNVRAMMQNLLASHRVVHIHANNFAAWSVVGGIPIPEVLEVTLCRTDRGTFEVSDETFPTALDMPCNSRLADYYLGKFEFA